MKSSTYELWRLAPPESTQLLARWVADKVKVESIKCPLDPGHQRPGKRLTELYVAAPEGSRNLGFLWTWPSELLVHESLLAAFEELEFSGYETRPAHVTFGDGRTYNTAFRELVVTGWGGIAPPESGIRRTFRCPACHHSIYSCFTHPARLINVQNLNGLDFFMVWPLPRYIFISNRVAQEFRNRRWSGALLEDLQDMSCHGSLTPGQLDFYMPEARVAQIRSSQRSNDLE